MIEDPTSTIEVNNSRKKILLVKDNKANLQMLYGLLETTGCRLLVARNGETALSVARKMLPKSILLDIMMPGIIGLEVCRRLMAEPETKGIPVIFLSAFDKTDDKVKGLQVGAAALLAIAPPGFTNVLKIINEETITAGVFNFEVADENIDNFKRIPTTHLWRCGRPRGLSLP